MLTDVQRHPSTEVVCGLAEEVVLTFGEIRLRVFGTSMVPSILPGDLVSIRQANLQDISLGEVVLFLQKGRLFVHRVVGRKVAATADGPDEPCLITRGDRLRHEDPPVMSSALLGRVVSVKRKNWEVKLLARASNSPFIPLLMASDRATYLYLRLAAGWRALFLRRPKCQA